MGKLDADAGSMQLPREWVIAHVAQQTPALDTSALQYVLEGDRELCRLRTQLAAAEVRSDGTDMTRLHDRIEAIHGYTAESRAQRLLSGLGFNAAEHDNPVRRFSGGWRMRLNLAQALMCRSDLLLLDEPTNHLDLDTVFWLQEWIRRYPGTCLIISHDRDFLDAISTRTAHIENRGIKLYPGNYSAFEGLRSEYLAQQAGSYRKQQTEIAHMESYVRRFRAKASKARQAQSRLKALARMQRIAPAHVDSPFHFSFPPAASLPHHLLRIDQARIGYDGKSVLDKLQLDLSPGERIGLIGRNGNGKSTLVKLLAGTLLPMDGERLPAKTLKVGYFAQHQVEQLHLEQSPLAHFQDLMQKLDTQVSEQQTLDFLGGFAFNRDMALEPVRMRSGGERARLVLALLVYQGPNLLLLDEPTNHLDLEMRQALCLALQGFDGALVLVSHDRHLLRSCCDRLWLVAAGSAQPFDGDLDDYANLLSREQTAPRGDKPRTADNNDRRQARKQRAQLRAQQKTERSQMSKIEQRLPQLQHALSELEAKLADPTTYANVNPQALKESQLQQAEFVREIYQLEEDWLILSESLGEA